MRKRGLLSLLLAGAMFCMTGMTAFATAEATPTETTAETAAATENVADPHEGMYRNELSGEWISSALATQRPVAIMVDNEKTALAHYGVNQSDIVYEIMNSTANGRITRLMCLVKDYAKITQFGSIRSVRPSNFMLAAEYNAILVHDGGPFYINDYIAQPWSDNLSAGFARFSNGKRTEFTEYVTYNAYTNKTKGRTYAGLKTRLAQAGFSKTYNEYYAGPNFIFSEAQIGLDAEANVRTANAVSLPFPHNSSKLNYNASTGTYDYYEYGKAHIDALTNTQTTFKNVIIQNCSFTQYDPNGYMVYNLVTGENSSNGYYLTNGKAIPITWSKAASNAQTVYRNANTGEELVLNTGKTYIAIVPSDSWAQVSIQ